MGVGGGKTRELKGGGKRRYNTTSPKTTGVGMHGRGT